MKNEHKDQDDVSESNKGLTSAGVPVWMRQILHTGTSDHLSNPRPRLGELVTVKLELPLEAKPEQIVLRSIPNGEQQLSDMKPTDKNGLMQVWEGKLRVNEARVPYRFAIQSEGQIWWFNAAGIHRHIPLGLFDFKLLADTPEIPWLQSSVFYQIFPDRFYNGDSSNDPINEDLQAYPGVTRTTYPWGKPAAQPKDHKHIPFYGGDLAGVEQKLDYLEDLGINAIYLNPIFTAYTNHRYDVADFRNVDPVLGGNQALVSLSESLKARKMRYILDIVPNHSGAGHPWFREAMSDPASPRRNAFYFDKDNAYASWMGFGSLPKLNYRDPNLRAEMFESDTSVFAHWLKPPYTADGWRVDVGNMLGRYDADQLDGDVLPAIRQTVKRISDASYLIGENFFEAIGQLQGDVWDGVMNYSGFSDPFLHWLMPYQISALGCKSVLRTTLPLDTESLIQSWLNNLAAIPYSIALQQFNLLGSHDTTRIATILKGDKALMKLAAIVQFGFPGVPCLYYGDEIGLQNEEGFAQRNCFPWDKEKWDLDLREFYQKLIRLRRSSDVLAHGSFTVLDWGSKHFAFQRLLNGERIVITANREDAEDDLIVRSPHLNSGKPRKLKGLFSGEIMDVFPGKLRIPRQNKGAEIWLEIEENQSSE